MKLARALMLVCSVLALSACGSVTTQQAADKPQVASLPPPPIEAIDEPAADTWWGDESESGATGSALMCLGEDSKSDDKACDPSPELKEEMRRQDEEFKRATTPAKGSESRAIARLRLEQGAHARLLLIAWKSSPGELCLADEEEDDEGGGGGGPFGPCVPGGHCREICLTYSGSLVGNEWVNTVAGVFPAKADLLRITFDGGRVSAYKLNGPLVPGFPEYRVFMLDLGDGLETRLQLFRGDTQIAEEKRSDAEIRMERCSRRNPVETMPSTREEAEKSPLARCFERAGSK